MAPSLFKRLFSSNSGSPRLAVIQYTRPRAGYGNIGDEEGFHWALVALQNDLAGGPARVEWVLEARDGVDLRRSGSCLGGVYIAKVQKLSFHDLKKAVESTATAVGGRLILTPKEGVPGWNCRDWLVETIVNVLIPNDWVYNDISSQASLLPRLKEASRQSAEALAAGDVVVVVEYK
ncbi:hypothetical protein FISHEDRAFT_75659 [Fistulina hepatica ATCC 64428]|uniref:Uncharacterized protein n=1 Tax=Fistulina hepatica ATCC 64428 TaxID=1128425 RepID=A0A0D7A7R6_9AGAR|nr:hypothetical protein FISHEDRAFT_75659 [Fistulina hepatica ATCC 64428]